MLTLLTATASNERSPRYMEKALAAIHQARIKGPPVTLIYGASDGELGLMLQCKTAQQQFVLEPILANYPQATATTVESETRTHSEIWTTDVRLVPELFPVLRHAQFEDLLNHAFADPASGLLRAIKPHPHLRLRVEIQIAAASHYMCHRAREAIRRLDRQFFRSHHRLAGFYARHIQRGRWRWIAFLLGLLAKRSESPHHSLLETTTSRLHEREEDLQAAADKIGGHLFEASLRLIAEGPRAFEAEALDRLQSMEGALGAFTRSRLATFQSSSIIRGTPKRMRPRFLLSHEELATLWHFPTATSSAERMRSSEFTELEAPVHFHDRSEPGTVDIGRVRFRDDERAVTLGLEDKRRHVYVVGKTGMGKSTLLQNMILADVAAGRGVCFVDPHGDLAETIIGSIPSHRTNDTIYFDAGSQDCVVGFNPLRSDDEDRIDQVTSGVVGAFKKIHGTSWGPRLEDTLRNAVFAVVERGGNLLSVMRLLGEKAFREQFVPLIRDEIVRGFWLFEFASWSENYRTEAVAAIQNKIRPFLTSRQVRAIVDHPGYSLNLRQIMDERKVLIVNLSKGRIGEDNSNLLGAFLVTSIEQAAMTRANILEADRTDFTLYADEFQNFQTGSFASVLSEARKYRLSLVVAHQYLSQLEEDTASAIWGNVGSVIAFQVGSDDASVLAEQFSKYQGQLSPENLTGLPKYTAYARLLINGLPSSPFSMQTNPPALPVDPERAEIIRRMAKRRSGTAF